MRGAIISFLAGLCSLCAAPALCQAAHPFLVEDAPTLGRGVSELELDVSVSGRDASESLEGDGALIVAIGLLERFDLELGIGARWRSDSRLRVRAANVGLKWLLLTGRESVPTVAVRADYAASLISSDASLGLIGSASWLLDPWELHLQLGGDVGGIGADELEPRLRLGAAAVAALCNDLWLSSEVLAGSHPTLVSADLSAVAGLAWLVWPAIELSAGGGVTLHGAGWGWIAGARVTAVLEAF